MKTKDVFSITLKIIGLIAFWKAIQTFGTMTSGIGLFSSIFSNKDHFNSSFMITIGLTMILNFLLPLIIAILFLFKTEKVLSVIKIKEQENLVLNIKKLVLYHMIIIVFGFMTIIHGTGNFIMFSYKKNTETEYITKNQLEQEKVIVTNSTKKDVNYFALIEIILGIFILSNATAIAKKTEKSLKSDTGIITKETNG
jgi:hypothetical protein